MQLVLNMFTFSRTLITYARPIFKPRCCLNLKSMRPQAKSTYIAHNMFGQIKIKIPKYNSWHTLISRKRDGKPRLISGQFVVVRVGRVHHLVSLQTPLILCFKSTVNSCMASLISSTPSLISSNIRLTPTQSLKSA